MAVLRRGRYRIGYPLLERAVYELLQLPADGLVQLSQRKELLVAERRGDPGGYDTHGTLGIWLVLRCPDAGRDDGRVIVLRHLM